jgi:hypothetical protein
MILLIEREELVIGNVRIHYYTDVISISHICGLPAELRRKETKVASQPNQNGTATTGRSEATIRSPRQLLPALTHLLPAPLRLTLLHPGLWTFGGIR